MNILGRQYSCPKKDIASILQENDIPTPRIISDLKEAQEVRMRNGILVRSEHPQDLHGSSGILHSYILDSTRTTGEFDEKDSRVAPLLNINPFREEKHPSISEESIQAFLSTADISSLTYEKIRNLMLWDSKESIIDHCRLHNLDVIKFANEVSFSIWEKINGQNMRVVADSAIPNRYHVFVPGSTMYVAIENDTVIYQSSDFGVDTSVELAINLYRRVKKIIGENRCDIMECIYSNELEEMQFLQWHAARQFQGDNIDEDQLCSIPGAVECQFVRGSNYPGQEMFLTIFDNLLRPDNEAMLGNRSVFEGSPYYEFLARRMKGYVYQFSGPLVTQFDHMQTSLLFKPDVSIGIDTSSFITDDEFQELYKEYRYGRVDIKVQLIANGKQAFIKRIGEPKFIQ